MATKAARGKPSRSYDLANAREGMRRFSNQLAELGIPKRIIDDFVQHHTVLTYRKDDVIFLQGSPCDLLSWVRGGVVAIAYNAPDGNRFVTGLAAPGQIFGHPRLVGRQTHPVHLFESRAHTACQIAVVSHERVLRAFESLEVANLISVLRNVIAVWAKTTEYWVSFLTMKYMERLQTIFEDLINRFGVPELQEARLNLQLGHQDLAEMIGSSRPVVSQLVATMLRGRKVERRGGHYVFPG